ncbi:SH3 domain-containing protein [Kalamiella sp. sgz302252]|uniref:SH3 domain-containing protein n=1 Tax=Pantoea sp. sgz302252 TaxID=3341827 RepID=UPI0036D23E23
MKFKTVSLLLTLLLAGCHTSSGRLNNNPIQPPSAGKENTLFPLDNYSQDINKWIPFFSPESEVPVLDAATQARHFSRLKAHYFGTGLNDKSPWNAIWIDKLISSDRAAELKDRQIDKYLSGAEQYYAFNFRELSAEWKDAVKDLAAVALPDASAGKAIVVRETLARSLPTLDPIFDDPQKPGQGFPFDLLQVSSVRPGTPAYVLATSRDKAWKYIVTPTIQAWVKSDDVASVDEDFVARWRDLAERQSGAFIKEPVAVNDGTHFYFTARPGTILPLRQQQTGFSIAIPVKQTDGSARIKWLSASPDEVAAMPLKMTPKNIAYLIKSMRGKPYGWGNYNFYNDCSAELRSLLMPFGIFLPRNSDAQAASGRVVDLSKEDVATRLNYLQQHGKPFTTLIHIDGHIMLYIGNATLDGKVVPMTYQNLWGLHTQPRPGRSIIGGSVFFPLLASYPEDTSLQSLADKPLFTLTFIE